MNSERPSAIPPGGEIVLYPGGAEIPKRVLPIVRRSFRVIAWLTVDDAGCEGVVFAGGGQFGGHSLVVQDGGLHYVYNFLGRQEQKLSPPDPVGTGHMSLGVEFTKTGHDSTIPTGTATLHVNDEAVASQPFRVQPSFFSLSGEGSNVGQPVSADYTPPFALTGATIDHVLLKPGHDAYLDLQRETEAAFRRDRQQVLCYLEGRLLVIWSGVRHSGSRLGQPPCRAGDRGAAGRRAGAGQATAFRVG